MCGALLFAAVVASEPVERVADPSMLLAPTASLNYQVVFECPAGPAAGDVNSVMIISYPAPGEPVRTCATIYERSTNDAVRTDCFESHASGDSIVVPHFYYDPAVFAWVLQVDMRDGRRLFAYPVDDRES